MLFRKYSNVDIHVNDISHEKVIEIVTLNLGKQIDVEPLPQRADFRVERPINYKLIGAFNESGTITDLYVEEAFVLKYRDLIGLNDIKCYEEVESFFI